MEVPLAIQRFASGQPARRLTLFDEMNKSPESGPSRALVTNASKYGLIKGSASSETLELTEDGKTATDEDASARERTRARVKLAIEDIEPFKTLYQRFIGNKLPARPVLADALKDSGLSEAMIGEAVDTFIVNSQFVGVLQTLSGAERLVTVDHLLDTLPAVPSVRTKEVANNRADGVLITKVAANFATTCFYVTPIGEDGSEQRKHSDLFLESIVEPAVEEFGLRVIRADRIEKPGTITRQVIEYLLKSRLIIADLSFHNPNVFYELAIRHASRLPTVQIVRAQDRIPFDVNQTRTVKVDSTDIYTLVPKLDIYRSEIANQVRRALEDPDAVDNPITVFWPSFKVEI